MIEHGRIRSPFISAEEARRLEATIATIEIHKPNDSELAVITESREAAGIASAE